MKIKKVKLSIIWVFCTGFFLTLSACGYKGKLYLAPLVEQPSTKAKTDVKQPELRKTQQNSADQQEEKQQHKPTEEEKTNGTLPIQR